MKENLAISDHLFKESGDYGTTVYCCAAAQALRAGARPSFPRTPAARLASRTLQTLRYTQLSMPSRPGARIPRKSRQTNRPVLDQDRSIKYTSVAARCTRGYETIPEGLND